MQRLRQCPHSEARSAPFHTRWKSLRKPFRRIYINFVIASMTLRLFRYTFSDEWPVKVILNTSGMPPAVGKRSFHNTLHQSHSCRLSPHSLAKMCHEIKGRLSETPERDQQRDPVGLSVSNFCKMLRTQETQRLPRAPVPRSPASCPSGSPLS